MAQLRCGGPCRDWGFLGDQDEKHGLWKELAESRYLSTFAGVSPPPPTVYPHYQAPLHPSFSLPVK